MGSQGIVPSHGQLTEHISYQVIEPTTPVFASATSSSKEAVFGFRHVLKLRLILTLNDFLEHVTSCDRITPELNDSDSIRRAPGFLAVVEGNGGDSMAPRGSMLFTVLPHGRFPCRSDSRPCRALGLRWHWFGRGTCHRHWLFVGEEKCGLCVFFATHFQVADFDSRIGLMLMVSTLGDPSKVFLEKVVICERRHPSSHSWKTKNHLGCFHASFPVWYLGCHWVG